MNIIFPLISFPYASHVLLPEGIGKVNFANSLIEYFTLIASLGIAPYAVREAAKIKDNPHKLNTFSREIFMLNMISTVIAYSALLVCFFFVDKFNDYKILIIISSTKILFATLGMEWLYRAEEEFGYITLRQIFFQVISLILLFSFVHTKDDYCIYAGIGVFANVGANAFNFIHSRKFINLLDKTEIDIKKHLKPVFTFFGITCAGKINSALDTVMLGFIIGDVAVGLYSAAIKITRIIFELINSAITSIMPRSSYYIENGKENEYREVIKSVYNTTFFFSCPAAAGLFFLCKPIIILFSGKQYIPAIPSMQLMTVSIVLTCTTSVLYNIIITPQRKERYVFYAQIIAAACNMALNFFLIQKYKVFGAALATLIVDSIVLAVTMIPSWKFINSFENTKNLLKVIISTSTMYITLRLTCNKISNNAIMIIVSALTGALIYAITSLVLKHPSMLMISRIITKRFRGGKN